MGLGWASDGHRIGAAGFEWSSDGPRIGAAGLGSASDRPRIGAAAETARAVAWASGVLSDNGDRSTTSLRHRQMAALVRLPTQLANRRCTDCGEFASHDRR
jgi:hypothetical protein